MEKGGWLTLGRVCPSWRAGQEQPEQQSPAGTQEGPAKPGLTAPFYPEVSGFVFCFFLSAALFGIFKHELAQCFCSCK